MTLPAEKKSKRKASNESASSKSHVSAERRSSRRGAPGEIGNALRSVYDGALNEDIPAEMLDLLGKLG